MIAADIQILTVKNAQGTQGDLNQILEIRLLAAKRLDC